MKSAAKTNFRLRGKSLTPSVRYIDPTTHIGLLKDANIYISVITQTRVPIHGGRTDTLAGRMAHAQQEHHRAEYILHRRKHFV